MKHFDKHPVTKVGQIYRDNDPRFPNRLLRVFRVDETHAWLDPMTGGVLSVRVHRSRLHTDGKPRKSGFSLEPK